MFSFDLDPDLKEGLELLKERDGAPLAVSIRKAIRLWLEHKDALPPEKGGGRRKANRGGKR
jgi:hypothetical protein